MASGLFSSIQSLSTKLLEAIRGTTSTSHQQDPASPPVTDQHKSVREDLEKLSRMLARIQAVQQDAEEREIHDRSVRLWLEELRGVAYQAEDVLDEFYYEVLRSIVESGDAAIEAYHRDGGTKRKFTEMDTSSSLASYSFIITKASIPDGMAEKIKCITERFEEISNARRDLHLREEDGTRLDIGPQIRPPTSSHVDERAIFGREEEKEKIVSLLNPSNGPHFMVLPIVAMGGFGKTTLAQLVYNDSRIRGLFNKICWVSVSEDFDLVRLTKAIVESVSKVPCQFSELNILQDVLKEKIRGLGLFLVLDDVWNEKRNMWECFRVPFFYAKFVRILTTTRNTSVAKIMQTTSPFQLGSLPEENCWSLFKHFAFGNREISENANLHKIGRGIVKKCKGSPLAIKALGGILHYEMDEEKWREILESDISEIDETGEIMPALWLSYRKLPRHLKPCFLYLSMFPKDTRFEKEMVVRLWIAQGYINGNTRNLKTLEEIGSEYFDELQGRSLVDGGHFTKYFLHDLIHDLARSISQEAYQLVLENDQQCSGPYKVYHLCLTEQDKLLGSFLPPNNCWSIRTVVNECPTENLDFAIFSKIAGARVLHLRYSLLPNTLGTLKHLRYLFVGHSQMEMLPETLCLLYNLQILVLYSFYLRELPENIKNLINLRYFQLNSSKIQQLPESIFLLRNLHTLSLRYCPMLQELPRGIEQLTRLCILDLPSSLIYMPSGIGKLTTLKPLSGNFSVMDHGMIGGLGELKDMNKLSGMLCITGLRNISDVEHSRNANLASKPNLHELILNFQEDRSTVSCGYEELRLNLVVHSSKNAKNENDEKIQDDVLESLQPHGNLRELAILNYGGRTFPSWLLNLLLPKLTTLTLNLCTEPNCLPPFGQLPYLRFLKILGRTGVRDVGDVRSTYSLLAEYGSSKQPKEPSYPSLEVLSLRNMLNLVEWQAHDGDFPCLKKLFIENCPKLWKIAIIPQKVREVTFNHCPKLKLLTCPSVLKKLTIHECGFCEIMFGSISDSLIISKCIELISINWIDGGLNSIRLVTFEYCPKLEVVTIPDGILTLIINECGFHEIMFQSVYEYLTISNCIELISINWREGGLNSVREVTFEYCPKLELIAIPVETLKLKIHECGFREIMFRSVSENLTISNCIELISINWREGGLNSVREVTFEYCPKLELIAIPVETLKLKIHECGFREIMFRSVSENLTISNCIELISINWREGGLNSVREVTFEYCPKLELIAIPVETLKLKIHECGFREIMFRSISENLTISNCIELISINWREGGLNSVREVTFEYCPKLELIAIPVETLKLKIHECGFREIMFRSVSENLTISNCIELISINWREGGLNSVREVTFEYCPKLELIAIPVETMKLKIHECGFREIMFRSVYEYLTISNCIELISINWREGGLNSVREVTFEYCPKLELIAIPVETLKLKIHECGFREIMFRSVSENLTMSNCIELISINWREGGLNSVREVTFEYCPKLELIAIPVETLKLKIHECGFREIMFRSVSENLTISNCAELILINWSDGGLNYVQEVTFECCPKLKLPTIPTGIKKLKIAYCGIQEIIFSLQSSIQMVYIFHCPLLTSIYWVKRETLSHTNIPFEDCPELQTVLKNLRISYCPILWFPLKDMLQSVTQRAEIYDCPRMNLGKRYVYQRDTTIEELNLFGNNEIRLSRASVNSTIPLLENPFTLFLIKEDFLQVESLTPSVGVNFQCIMLNLASLVILEILRCRKVISVTGLDNLSNLKRLSISYCPELCNWNDRTLPLSLKFLELNYCDKLSSLPLLSVQNHSSVLKVLVIMRCPRLALLEGFHGLMNLKTVELLHCGNISISPGTESLQFRPRITIGDCPLMRDWCRRNSITYYELIDNPQDDREAKLESAEQEIAKRESGEQGRAGST